MQHTLPPQITLKNLTNKNLSLARRLCDSYVGEGMYSEKELGAVCRDSNRFFRLVYKGEEPVGYFYCYITDAGQAYNELKVEQVRRVCEGLQRVGLCRSIGLREDVRGEGLSEALLRSFTGMMFENGCDIVLIPAWKQGDYIPAKRHIENVGAVFLCDIEKPWINVCGLKCPYCKNEHCTCDAVVYVIQKGKV